VTKQPAIIESSLQPIEHDTEKPIWSRLPDEPAFWYNRYKRFQGLGPKRTMLAALQQERLASKVPKSTQNGQKPKPKSKSGAVPGSWKQASIKWNWVQRALAFDEDKIEHIVAGMFESLYDGPALAYNRIKTLQNMLDAIDYDLKAYVYMTADQKLGYYARMQKILQAIADEMKTFDHATQALILRHLALKEYEDFKSPTTPEGYLQLQKRAGGAESLRQQIEAEIAMRKELAQIKEALSE
jgi:hypothetical protein